jgi:putative ABC transport system permease protein
MLKHLFKLIWNKKKQNFLLITEILISFMVIFAVFTLLVNYYQNYKKPVGIDYADVWAVNYNNQYKTNNPDSLNLFYESIRQSLKQLPQIKEVCYTNDNYPFADYTNGGQMNYNGKVVGIDNYFGDISYKSVLNVPLVSGRWFEKQDVAANSKHVLINALLKEKLFGKEEAVGKVIFDYDKKPYKVIGVVGDIKYKGDYVAPKPSLYNMIDTGSFHWIDAMLIKVTPGANATVEGRVYKILSNGMKNSNIEIKHLTNMHDSINKRSVIPMLVLLIVAAFLIINVALGLFGVLWYNINRRRGEIGLRRAIGATGNSVSSQLVSEALILATFSLIIGTFFAVQFPLLNVFDLPAVVYLMALGLSIGFIYLLVLVCSLYPGKQAAAIYPAVALHEE